MNLDIRVPVLVVTGEWNPALFQLPWVAQHLMNIPKGTQISAAQLITVAPPNPPRTVIYIENVGVSISGQRFEVYINDLDEQTTSGATAVARRIFEVLPHTPFGSLGINFQFNEPDPDVHLIDSLKTTDGIDQKFTIKRQEFGAVIADSVGVDLNFKRSILADKIVLDFNYHYADINIENFKLITDNLVKSRLLESTNTLRDLYRLDNYDLIKQELEPSAQETTGG